ncbi:hypothetical protein [Nocardia sp. NPDC051832]|uniref:hypothetical protein n=1 Tax=Nocardia sp. NPDC051832 TaxID=3155673 RepID=UPI0034202DA9
MGEVERLQRALAEARDTAATPDESVTVEVGAKPAEAAPEVPADAAAEVDDDSAVDQSDDAEPVELFEDSMGHLIRPFVSALDDDDDYAVVLEDPEPARRVYPPPAAAEQPPHPAAPLRPPWPEPLSPATYPSSDDLILLYDMLWDDWFPGPY